MKGNARTEIDVLLERAVLGAQLGEAAKVVDVLVEGGRGQSAGESGP